ncbi:hypothetical protein ACA910_015784 [Epithemia clementina (nom. ined.)]
MPPKNSGDQASKKTVQKKKQQIVEDKTFGLKNKNKSKKVQQQVASITRNVMNSGDPKMRKLEEERSKAKAERKARAKAEKEEQDALFGAALLAVQKKSTINQKDGKIEAQGRDANDGADNKKNTSRAMKMMYQMDAQEMSDKLKEDPNYVPTLEDEIEDQRQKMVAELKASGKPGTPVTPESFAIWQESKRKKRQEEARKKVEAEMKKKKGGKGLSVLSGRDLYEYKRDLFKDRDDNDDDVDAYNNDDNENDGEGNENDKDDDTNDGGKPRQPTKQNGANDGVDDDEEDSKLPAVPENKAAAATTSGGGGGGREYQNGNVQKVAAQVQSNLFLEGDDDDLDDIDDDDEDE